MPPIGYQSLHACMFAGRSLIRCDAVIVIVIKPLDVNFLPLGADISGLMVLLVLSLLDTIFHPLVVLSPTVLPVCGVRSYLVFPKDDRAYVIDIV